MFCEESLGKINSKNVELFRNRSVESVHYFEQVNTSVVEKTNLNEHNFDG